PIGFDPAEFATRSRLDQAALWCATNALRDAGLWDDRRRLRVGLILGVGSEWLLAWEADALHGGRLINEPGDEERSHLSRVKAELGLTGPSLMLSTACSSANYALTLARRWLRSDMADAVVAGACDMNATPLVLAAFSN